MNDDLDPIYDFSALKDFLSEKGYQVGDAHGWKTVVEKFNPMDAIRDGTMRIQPDAIYVVNPKTKEERQVFIYKYDYWLHQYGENQPRFHICKCSTIEDFMIRGAFDGHYVRANVDPVPVFSKENYEIEVISNLQLCHNCANRIRQYRGISSSEFAEILRRAYDEDKPTEEQEVDLFGYTRDWDDRSRAYREKHNYTCEICGLKIDDFYDRQYIHCHHKDANKLNNKEDNLQCLCLRCHANIDETHRKNLTTGANRILYQDFENKYPNKITAKDDDEEITEVTKPKEMPRIENEEESDITFIKNRILQVNKRPYFTYLAIPNLLIGDAFGAETVKKKWLDNPSQYKCKLMNRKGITNMVYNINGGYSYQEFSFKGNENNIDEVAQYTYHLFKKMNVLNQFKENGHKAIEYINEKALLA